MVNINLKVLDIEDIELKRIGRAPYIFTRIFAFVGYKKKDGDFFIRRSIVDTGAVASLLPISMWKQQGLNLFTELKARLS